MAGTQDSTKLSIILIVIVTVLVAVLIPRCVKAAGALDLLTGIKHGEDSPKEVIYYLQDHGPEVVIVNNRGEECAVIDMQDGVVTVNSNTKKTKVKVYLDRNRDYAYSEYLLRGESIEIPLPGSTVAKTFRSGTK